MGGPPRMSVQHNAGATSDTTRTLKMIHTIHSHIHSKADMLRMIMMAKLYSGNHGGLKLPTFVLQVRKNPEKTSPRKLVSTADRTRARCVKEAQATACSTAVDLLITIRHYCFSDAYVIVNIYVFFIKWLNS